MRLSLLAVAAAFALGASATPAAANGWTGPEVVDLLNFQRAANGLPAVTHDAALTQGCAEHMAYLKLNGKFQHEQDPGDPGTTPAGAEAGITSVLTSGTGTFAPDGTNAFERAPVHLMQMLSPWMMRSGASGGCLVTLAQPTRTFPAPAAYTYPGDGGVAPASEVARELPFVPGDFVGLPQGTTTGPHLYFFATGPGPDAYDLSRGAFTAVKLTGPAGADVPVKWLDDTTSAQIGGQLRHIGDFMAPGGIVIPIAPLQVGVRYTAAVTFKPNGGNGTPADAIKHTWSFTAGVEAAKPPLPARPTPTPAVAEEPVVAEAAVVAPLPTPSPAPRSAPPKVVPVPLKLTTLRLAKGAVVVGVSADAPLWIAIEQKRITKGRSRKITFRVRQTLKVTARAGTTQAVAHRKLPKGDYRLTVRLGRPTGAVQLRKAVKVR